MPVAEVVSLTVLIHLNILFFQGEFEPFKTWGTHMQLLLPLVRVVKVVDSQNPSRGKSYNPEQKHFINGNFNNSKIPQIQQPSAYAIAALFYSTPPVLLCITSITGVISSN